MESLINKQLHRLGHDENMKQFKHLDGTINANLFLGNTIVEVIAQDSAGKLESKPFTLSGKVAEVWEQSAGHKLRMKLSKRLSKHGIAALGIIKESGQYIIDIFTVNDWSSIGSKWVKASMSNGTWHTYQGQNYSVNMEATLLTNGKWQVETAIYPLNKKFVIKTDIFDSKPFQEFDNNGEFTSDIDNVKCQDIVRQLNYFGTQIGVNYEFGSTKYSNNRNLTKNDADMIQRQIMSGKKVFDDKAFDAKVATSIVPIGTGLNDMGAVSSYVLSLEDKLLKYAAGTRDTLGNGSNNHTLEIITAAQYQTEYTTLKLAMREKDYNNFFQNLASLLGETHTPFKMELSDIELLKIETLRAEAQLKVNKLKPKEVANGSTKL